MPSKRELEALFVRFPKVFSSPLHLCVADPALRSGKRAIASHVEPQEAFEVGFLQAAPGVHVASPELCLAQLCRGRHPARVAQVAFELCGRYRRDSRSSTGFVAAPPLTTCERIRDFAGAPGPCVKGVKILRKVMAFVSEGSRSPMETDVAILLSFSRQRGGRGFSGFTLNGRVDVPSRLAKSVNQPYYHVDFLWSERRVAVEYDSDLAHVGSDRIARDAGRKNSLQLLGYTTLTLTRMQLMSWDDFSLFVSALEKAVGVRRRSDGRDYESEQKALWHLLLGSLSHELSDVRCTNDFSAI